MNLFYTIVLGFAAPIKENDRYNLGNSPFTSL